MSKDKEPKSVAQLPAEAEIFAATLRSMRSQMSEAPANPGTEAEIVRRHFMRAGHDQNTQDADLQANQPSPQQEEPVH